MQAHTPGAHALRYVQNRLELIVGVAQHGLRHDDVSLSRFHLRLGLHQLDRRQRAQFHPHGVLRQEVFRELLRLTLGVQVLDAKNQVPVAPVHGKHRIQNRLNNVLLGDLLSDLRLSNRCLVDRNAEVAQHRVREGQLDTVLKQWIVDALDEASVDRGLVTAEG